jgi:hypothetical protein
VIEISSFYGAQLNRCILLPLHLRTETEPVPKRHVSTPKNTGRWRKSKKPVTLYEFRISQTMVIKRELRDSASKGRPQITP